MQRRAKDYSDGRRFLWTDRPEAHKTLAAGEERFLGKWKTRDTSALRQFIDQGYSILPEAVRAENIAEFQADLSKALADRGSKIPMTYWDDTGHHYDVARPDKLVNREAKVLDLHVRLKSAQTLIFAPPLVAFLKDVFQEEPVAFQTLYFEYGSQQGAHQDTAFVYTEPAYHFIASWIALEDIQPNSGELFYYPGSHKMADLLFAGGEKALRPGDPDGPRYSTMLEEAAMEQGLQRTRFLPKRGDVLFWASDLVHGGETIAERRTRKSLVTHYCPRSATVPYARDKRLTPTRLSCGGWVVGAY